MGYGIKYSTSNSNNTLRRGNVTTTAAHSADPSANFHSGIPLENGKHTVVQVHTSNDPDFWSLNDSDFVRLCNSLGANILTPLEAKNYIKTQNSIFYVDGIVYDSSIMVNQRLNLNSKFNESFIDNEPTTNLLSSNPSMLPTDPSIFYYSTSTTSQSNVGGSGWTWSFYPNSNISSDGGMIWNPTFTDPYGQPGVWVMKRRPGGNSESNWSTTPPGAIDETKDHIVSVWCKTDQSNCFRIHLNVTKNGASNWGYASSFHTGGGEWERLTVSLPKNTAITSINTVRCQALYTNITADAQFKYYQVEEGVNATSFTSGTRSQNNTFYDLSGYSNNFTPLTDVDFNGQSFEFNGTTSYMQDSVSSFNPDGAPNVMEVLFKPMDLGSRRQAIFSDNYGPEYGIWIYSNNSLRGVAYTSVSTSNIEVGRWYYAVLNVQPGANKSSTDQTYIQFYVNGQLIGSNNANTGNGMNDQPFSLGFDYKSNNPNDFFSGSIALAKLSYGEYSQKNVNQSYYGGNIVTDGLKLAVDAGNLVSYESGSIIAYNLTGSETGDLDNGVKFNSINGGVWDFDGVDDQIDFGNPTNLSNSQVTVTFWYNPTTIQNNTHGGIINGRTPNGRFCLFWYGTDEVSIQYRDDSGLSRAAGGVWTRTTAPTPVSTTDQWYFISITGNEDTDEWRVGVNLDVSTSDFGSQYVDPDSNQWLLGRRSSAAYDHSKMANLQIYDRILSSDEIQQNYIAHKARFPS